MPTPSARTSLPLHLSLVLSATIALFWLFTTSVALYLDFREDRTALVAKLQSQTRDRAARVNEELEAIAHDVRTLRDSWVSEHVQTAEINPHFLAARYLPDQPGGEPSAQVQRALAFIEAYGGGGVGYVLDTFMVLDGGVVLSNANGPAHPRNVSHMLALRQAPARNGLVWGTPYQGSHGDWRIAVASILPHDNALVGFTMRLGAGFGQSGVGLHDEQVMWLDNQGQALAPLPPLARQVDLTALPSCAPLYSRLTGGIRTVCAAIEPSGWRVGQLYPTSELNGHALASMRRRAPVALIGLVALVALLYVVLQRSLGRTLADFVQVISPQQAVREQLRLPEQRRDELGRIAKAYNRLLDAVQLQYADLEAKVEERTVELAAAKLRAEQATANKSEQITNISHEIRTPLNGIVGGLMLLRSTDCDNEQHDLIDTTLKCSAHLLEIIHNMLDFSRIDAGEMVIHPSTLDPLTLIDQAMLTVQVAALNKQLQLRTEVAAGVPPTLHTDGMRVRQILINLLGNAVKFTPSGGAITLTVWTEGQRICFNVNDTGPGIPDERQATVFAAFQQLDVHSPGSGLGLPIARSLARLLGGELRLMPTPNGSCFQLTLPISQEAPAPAPRGPIAAPQRLHNQLRAWGYKPHTGANPALEAPELAYLPERLRHGLEGGTAPRRERGADTPPQSAWSLLVLVVDDVDTNRDIISRILRQQGHRTHEASSGEAALELGRKHVFDLVLLDMRMPGLNGSETLMRWRDEEQGMLDPDCPVIALTANAQPGERERLLAAGFNEYLTKPATPVMLARALEHAADLQLARGNELEFNAGAAAPVLAHDTVLLGRLRGDLLRSRDSLGSALAAQDRATALTLLHTLKGVAGQAGLELLCEAAEQWEQQIAAGATLDMAPWTDFCRLIDSEMGELAEQLILGPH